MCSAANFPDHEDDQDALIAQANTTLKESGAVSQAENPPDLNNESGWQVRVELDLRVSCPECGHSNNCAGDHLTWSINEPCYFMNGHFNHCENFECEKCQARFIAHVDGYEVFQTSADLTQTNSVFVPKDPSQRITIDDVVFGSKSDESGAWANPADNVMSDSSDEQFPGTREVFKRSKEQPPNSDDVSLTAAPSAAPLLSRLKTKSAPPTLNRPARDPSIGPAAPSEMFRSQKQRHDVSPAETELERKLLPRRMLNLYYERIFCRSI